MKIIVLGGDGKLVERPPQSGEQTLVLPEPFGELNLNAIRPKFVVPSE